MNKIKVYLSKLRTNKKLQIIIVISLCSVVLILILFNKLSNNGAEKETLITNDYCLIYENKLKDVLQSIDGVGKVKVIISLESGTETVLAMKTTTKSTANGIETESSPILVNGKTVVVKELFPKVSGVLIVAQGADKLMIRNKLEQATSSLFNINVNQIEIFSM